MSADEHLLPPRRRNDDDDSNHLHRLTIGALGFALPPLVVLIARWRPTAGLPEGWQPLGSISAYYYSGATAVFTGVLCALAVFLFTYRGYKNASQSWDIRLAIIAGIAALGVAFFPTEPPLDALKPSWWTSLSGDAHLASAMLLFGTFAVFALWLFPKCPTVWQQWFYRACGLGIVTGIVWALLAKRAGHSIFWPEALALWSFAIAWLVKGKLDHAALIVARRSGHQVMRFVGMLRHP